MGRPAELSHRADREELDGFSGAPVFHTLLNADAGAADWRLVETFSEGGQPFELELSWSAGSGAGAKAKLTVAHSTRVAVFARSLTLRVANLSTETNRVGATVADGFANTTNVWEQRDHCDGASPVTFPIPSFARRFRLELADSGLLTGARISVYDGQGTLRAQLVAASQPADGIFVGGAGRIEVLTTAATDLRGLFTLSL